MTCNLTPETERALHLVGKRIPELHNAAFEWMPPIKTHALPPNGRVYYCVFAKEGVWRGINNETGKEEGWEVDSEEIYKMGRTIIDGYTDKNHIQTEQLPLTAAMVIDAEPNTDTDGKAVIEGIIQTNGCTQLDKDYDAALINGLSIETCPRTKFAAPDIDPVTKRLRGNRIYGVAWVTAPYKPRCEGTSIQLAAVGGGAYCAKTPNGTCMKCAGGKCAAATVAPEVSESKVRDEQQMSEQPNTQPPTSQTETDEMKRKKEMQQVCEAAIAPLTDRLSKLEAAFKDAQPSLLKAAGIDVTAITEPLKTAVEAVKSDLLDLRGKVMYKPVEGAGTGATTHNASTVTRESNGGLPATELTDAQKKENETIEKARSRIEAEVNSSTVH